MSVLFLFNTWLARAAPDAEQVLSDGFNNTQWVLLSTLPLWVYGILGLVALLALGLSWRSTRAAKTPIRVVFTTLRALAALLLLLLLAEPGIRSQALSKAPNRVVVALDTSASMAQKEGALTRVQRGAREVQALLKRVQSESTPFVVDVYSFDEGLQKLSPERLQALADGREAAQGEASSLTAIFEALSSEKGRMPLGGVVLVSDGAQTEKIRGEQHIAFMKEHEAPIHAVHMGSAQDFQDLALNKVDAPDFAFVRNPVTATVQVRQRGYEGEKVLLTLLEDGKPLKSTNILLADKEQSVSFEFEPKEAGKRVYSIQAPLLKGEAVSENNRIDFPLQIIRDRIRVLQLTGRPSWDERFVRRLLKENPSVDLISFFILRTPTDVSGAPNTELSLIPFPTRELFTEELNTFDVVIFQDFNFRPYNMGSYLKNVKEFVEKAGGGFMMIGGELSFSEAGYENTPIADILPVTLEPGHGRIHIDPFHPQLTPAGRTHPITDLGDVTRGGYSAEPFADLPPLVGVNTVRSLAPGAETLLSHPFLNASGSPAPVVAVREVGKGRSVAIMTDTTWKWALPHVGAGGRGDAHRRFFANTLRWLIKDPELSRVKITTDQSQYEPGEAVVVSVRTFDSSYAPQGDVEVVVEIKSLELNESAETLSETLRTDASGRVRYTFEPKAPGTFRVSTKAKAEGRSIGADDDAFVVRSLKTESAHIEPRRDLLQTMATQTLGQVVPEGESGSLAFKDQGISKVHRQKTEPLGYGEFILAALVLLLAIEWYWRRRKGFV